MERYKHSVPYDMIHLCIDEYNQYMIEGRAYNNTISSPIIFHDIKDLALQIDQLFDKNGHPMSSQQKRSFKKEKNQEVRFQLKPQTICSYDELLKETGNILTLDLIVKSRHSSSWQGLLFYQDQSYEFKDMLEIIKRVSLLLKERKQG